MVEFSNEGMFKPVNEHFGNQNRQNRLLIAGQSVVWLNYKITYIGDCPQDIIAPNPSEALGEHKPFSEVKLGTTQFYQIAESNNAKHKSQCETLHDV